ncbi:MerR family transcriptional regulator [Actinomadura sp. 6N118]|uniref:MerR family transcriptional regulator n=1 Tax=Actinomadura sp. 6N118 TaxID=3375151 RepID=UPI00378892B6
MTDQEYSHVARKQIGQLAKVHNLAEGTWITVRDAKELTGMTPGVLTRWEEEGVISCFQPQPGSPRMYLREELELLAGLRTNGRPPGLRVVRRLVEQLQAEQGAR